MHDDLGPWRPLGLSETVELFHAAPFRWWISGGNALDLHLRRSWRAHEDTDVGILRRDTGRLDRVLIGWDIHVAAAGSLSAWDGRPLEAARNENNLWCRPTPESAWALDVTVGDGDEHEWVYRRDSSVRRTWSQAVLIDENGVPYLAPEIQLLFKSKNLRPKDQIDASIVIPELAPERRFWLAAHLDSDHEWQALVGPTT